MTHFAWPRPIPWIFLGALAASACGGVVIEGNPSGGSGGQTSSTSTGSKSSSKGGATTTSGVGGMTPLPEPSCVFDEGLVVAASSSVASRVRVRTASGWTAEHAGAPATSLAATVDPYGAFSVLSTSASGAPSFVRSTDGLSFEPHAVNGWAPLAPVVAPTVFAYGGSSVLLGRTQAGASLAYFDPDAFDWYSWQTVPPGFDVTSSVALGADAAVMVVGRGLQGQLCDAEMPSASFDPIHCFNTPAPSGGEIPVTPPKAISLPNGDAAIVFFSAAGSEISVTTRHHGVWSPMSATSSDKIGVVFDAAPVADGKIAIAVTSTSGELSLLWFDPAAGFGAPVHVADHASIQGVQAAAPGVCGDDALFAYLTDGHRVDIARIRGTQSATETVFDFVDEFPEHVALAIRRASH